MTLESLAKTLVAHDANAGPNVLALFALELAKFRRPPNFTSDRTWEKGRACGADADLKNWSNPGKWEAWIKCDGFTSQADRSFFFKKITSALVDLAWSKKALFPVIGKIAIVPDNYNRVPIMFYADEANQKQKEILIELLLEAKDIVVAENDQFKKWFKTHAGQKTRTATWNFTWKSDAATYAELNAGTHYSQQRACVNRC